MDSVDIVGIVKCGGVDLELFENFFRHNMQYKPHTEFLNDLVAKRGRYKKQRRDLLQKLSKKIANSVFGRNIRWDVNDHFKCVTDNWMKENYNDRVKE